MLAASHQLMHGIAIQTSGRASKTLIIFFNSTFPRLLPFTFSTIIMSFLFHLPSISSPYYVFALYIVLSDRSLWSVLLSMQKGRNSSCKSPLLLSTSTSPGQANCSVNAPQCSKPKKWLHLPYVVQTGSEGFISLCTLLRKSAYITHILSALNWVFVKGTTQVIPSPFTDNIFWRSRKHMIRGLLVGPYLIWI